MVDETGPPFQSFAGGFFSGRVMSELRESAEQTWYQMQSVDAGGLQTGATITAGQTTQATGYQIQAAITNFATVTPAPTGNGNTPTAAAVLPQTSRPEPLAGLLIYVSNIGANPINLYAHPNDTNNSINGLGANIPVILGVNTITAIQCITPGVWQTDGIGEGFMGSIATTVSQGTVVAAGTSSQSAATPITQAMASVSSSAANQGVALPRALAGAIITLNPTGVVGNTPLLVWPVNGGTDSINPGAANASFSVTLPVSAPIIFYCFSNGVWYTK